MADGSRSDGISSDLLSVVLPLRAHSDLLQMFRPVFSTFARLTASYTRQCALNGVGIRAVRQTEGGGGGEGKK